MSKRKHLPQADQPAEHRPPACDQVRVADLKPQRYLSCQRTAAPGAEPDRDELVSLPRTGKPYSVVMSDFADVIRADLVAAALRQLRPVAGDATDAIRGDRRETTGVRS